jgi:small subunit ribosomal protein S16
MAVTIRLAKIGKRNRPAFKVVVSNTRDKRNGRFLDILGFFDPYQPKENQLKIDTQKVEEWRGKGALITTAVEKLIEGTYEFKPYEPKKKGEESKEPATEDMAAQEEDAVEEAKAEGQEEKTE